MEGRESRLEDTPRRREDALTGTLVLSFLLLLSDGFLRTKVSCLCYRMGNDTRFGSFTFQSFDGVRRPEPRTHETPEKTETGSEYLHRNQCTDGETRSQGVTIFTHVPILTTQESQGGSGRPKRLPDSLEVHVSGGC